MRRLKQIHHSSFCLHHCYASTRALLSSDHCSPHGIGDLVPIHGVGRVGLRRWSILAMMYFDWRMAGRDHAV